jgi:glutamate carboxypeptidase
VIDLLAAAERERAWTVALVTSLAEIESPSTDRAALERCAAHLAERCRETGARVRREAGAPTADHVVAEWSGRGRPLLLIGHFDTVWPVGQLARMPVRQVDGRLHGPGVLDMKAGLAVALAAMKVLTTVPESARPPVTLLATSDEEVGSATSRKIIETMARASAAALVLEPALPGGAVKTARKGVGEFDVRAHGVAAHAGADPSAGASAVHELARQVAAMTALADPDAGLTVNVGVIEGGTRSNVVAEEARALVDVRVSRVADGPRIESALQALRSSDPRVRLEVRGGVNRPPMERGPGVAKLFELARDVARAWGEDLAEGATGGASDGNFTAALGVPTLDGLGGVGDGPHALHEYVLLDFLPKRVALLAGLLARAGADLR